MTQQPQLEEVGPGRLDPGPVAASEVSHNSAGHQGTCRCDPVGVVEIAARLQVQRATVDQWRWRGLLPEPRWSVGGRPAWCWRDVAAWARETGRLEG